jgi:hypothetical protein
MPNTPFYRDIAARGERLLADEAETERLAAQLAQPVSGQNVNLQSHGRNASHVCSTLQSRSGDQHAVA